jgi:hypothetical protein
LERGVACGEHVLAIAANAEPLALGAPDVSELRREHDLVTPARIARPTSSSFVKGP